MKTYWWRHDNGEHNFGDELNTLILDRLGFHHQLSSPDEAELVAIGSVLEHLPAYWPGSVVGAGKQFEDTKLYLSDARVFALRGKLTLSGTVGLGGHQPVLGDPGLLASYFVRQPRAKYDLGVVPHHRDHELYQRFSYGRYIDPRQPAEKVIQEIASCKRIVSSSLHGLVVADAFEIPRQAEPFLQQLPDEGGDFKFRDYASVYDTDPHWGHMWKAPRDKVQQIQQQLYDALLVAAGIDLSTENPRHPQVSLLVPFRDDGEHRGRIWHWLRRYWRAVYPEAEIIQGHDDGTPFSKATAVNHAASLARGRSFCIIDADAYLAPSVIKGCVDRIDEALQNNERAWFMPYDRLYRLNEQYTMGLLKGDPAKPILLPPNVGQLEDIPIEAQSNGHQYGALAQIMPREAFGLVEGMDPRFRGWGGEDVSFLKAVDTMYQQHEVVPGPIAHFWHAKVGKDYRTRQWVGQGWATANSRLSQRYMSAAAEPGAMRHLAEEHKLGWAHDLVQTADGLST